MFSVQFLPTCASKQVYVICLRGVRSRVHRSVMCLKKKNLPNNLFYLKLILINRSLGAGEFSNNYWLH